MNKKLCKATALLCAFFIPALGQATECDTDKFSPYECTERQKIADKVVEKYGCAIQGYVNHALYEYGTPLAATHFVATVAQESLGDPNAYRKDTKVKGLGQIKSGTFSDIQRWHPDERWGEGDLYDPQTNLKALVLYYSWMMRRYPDTYAYMEAMAVGYSHGHAGGLRLLKTESPFNVQYVKDVASWQDHIDSLVCPSTIAVR